MGLEIRGAGETASSYYSAEVPKMLMEFGVLKPKLGYFWRSNTKTVLAGSL